MARSGLLTAIMPQLASMRGIRQNRHHAHTVYDHSLHVLAALEAVLADPQDYFDPPAARHVETIGTDTRVILKLTALLHDVGKPACRTVDSDGRVHFYGHAKKSAAIAEAIGRDLKLSNQDRRHLVFLVHHHQRPLSLFLSAQQNNRVIPGKALGRFLRLGGDQTPNLMLLSLADHMGKGVASPGMARFIRSLMGTYFDKQPAAMKPFLNGNDLVNGFKLSPSPLIGELLMRLQQAQLAGAIRDRQEAMAWVGQYLDQMAESQRRK